MALEVRPEDPFSPDARQLTSQLDHELLGRYPHMRGKGNPVSPTAYAEDRGLFLVARLDGVPVGCVALRAVDEATGEIKRMFVRPGARRTGVGRALLAQLEHLAAERGFETLRLETGNLQPEAIQLYQKTGYHPIPCFPPYHEKPESRCFAKRLKLPPESLQ